MQTVMSTDVNRWDADCTGDQNPQRLYRGFGGDQESRHALQRSGCGRLHPAMHYLGSGWSPSQELEPSKERLELTQRIFCWRDCTCAAPEAATEMIATSYNISQHLTIILRAYPQLVSFNSSQSGLDIASHLPSHWMSLVHSLSSAVGASGGAPTGRLGWEAT